MRYHIFFIILFSLLIVESGISQEYQVTVVKQVITPVISDTIDQDLPAPIPEFGDSTGTIVFSILECLLPIPVAWMPK